MEVIFKAPPVRKQKRMLYGPLMNVIEAHPGEWVCPDLNEIQGQTISQKRHNVISAATWRKIRVQTSVQEGVLYVRSIPDVREVANA